MLPEHDVVIIDEAHDLVDRVTSVATAELSAPAVETAARRAGRQLEEGAASRLERGRRLEQILAEAYGGRIDVMTEPLATSLAALRDAAGGCAADSGPAPRRPRMSRSNSPRGGRPWPRSMRSTSAAERILDAFGQDVAARPDVVWLDQPADRDSRRPPTLRVAPLQVSELLAGARVRPQDGGPDLGHAVGRRRRSCRWRTQWGLPQAGSGPPEPRARRRPPAPRNPTASGRRRRPAGHGQAPDGLVRALTSARRSTTRAAGSCTWRGTCRRPDATGCRGSTSTRSRSSSPRPGADARAVLLDAGGQAGRDELRGRIDYPLLCQGEDPTSQLITPVRRGRGHAACSAPCRCGRAWTCPARRCSS